ncbi:putative flippase GtrA [Kushneria sinocarnis]|uniref:Putative flippase GtrA n=1 Tax=Kushneria sinocarnis TaxID=595502 RepID=A0A420WTF7_9GAMM|nr:GtrA family protein [Kushneria sinocarnis]RKQ96325.1 putative flippase GtrA [Kushneria sinocarnis]
MKAILGEAGRITRFGLVGGAATLIHLMVAGALLGLFAGLSPFIANVVAFLVAFLVSLYGHRHITFNRQGSAVKFFVVALAGFALNNFLLASMLAMTPLPDFVALTISTLAVPVVSYLAARLWAFR